MPNSNSQWCNSPDTHIPHKQVAEGWEEQAALLRLRIRPECPEGNLRELA